MEQVTSTIFVGGKFVRGWTVGAGYTVRVTLRPASEPGLLELHCEWAPEVPDFDEDLTTEERQEHMRNLTAAIESITEEIKGDAGGGTRH